MDMMDMMDIWISCGKKKDFCLQSLKSGFLLHKAKAKANF